MPVKVLDAKVAEVKSESLVLSVTCRGETDSGQEIQGAEIAGMVYGNQATLKKFLITSSNDKGGGNEKFVEIPRSQLSPDMEIVVRLKDESKDVRFKIGNLINEYLPQAAVDPLQVRNVEAQRQREFLRKIKKVEEELKTLPALIEQAENLLQAEQLETQLQNIKRSLDEVDQLIQSIITPSFFETHFHKATELLDEYDRVVELLNAKILVLKEQKVVRNTIGQIKQDDEDEPTRIRAEKLRSTRKILHEIGINIPDDNQVLSDVVQGNIFLWQEVCEQSFRNTNKITVLPLEIAQRLTQYNEECLNLNGLTSIPPDVAQILAKHKNGIFLNGLNSVTPDVAIALAQHSAELHLNGIESISPEVVQAVAEHKGKLFLQGLSAQSSRVMHLLLTEFNYQGTVVLSNRIIDLGNKRQTERHISALEEPATKPILNHRKLRPQNNYKIWKEILKGDFSKVSELTEINPKIAQVLIESPGTLFLNNILSITLDTARVLAKHNNGVLFLNGLTSLAPDVAQALAEHKSGLFLNGLTSITLDVAQALAKHKETLSLEGITSITPDVAQALAEHMDWLYVGLTSIPPGVAQVLVEHKGWLYLNSLTSIDLKVVRILAKYQGHYLCFRKLRNQSIYIIKMFSDFGYTGELSFD